MYAIVDTDREIVFSMEKYSESSKRFISEFVRLIEDDTEKKWKVEVSDRKPSHEILKTWGITKEEDLSLRTHLTNSGPDSEAEFTTDRLKIKKVSSVSEFLEIILNLSKPRIDNDSLVIKEPWYSKTTFITCVSLSALVLLSIYYQNDLEHLLMTKK